MPEGRRLVILLMNLSMALDRLARLSFAKTKPSSPSGLPIANRSMWRLLTAMATSKMFAIATPWNRIQMDSSVRPSRIAVLVRSIASNSIAEWDAPTLAQSLSQSVCTGHPPSSTRTSFNGRIRTGRELRKKTLLFTNCT